MTALHSPQVDSLGGYRDRSAGQSVVEFALVLPVLAFILVGIYDFSRVFTSMMAVESAAREAADYGAWQSGNWVGNPADTDSARYKTVAGMEARACIATRNLTDYEGTTASCSNPSISVDLIDENGHSAIGSDGALLTNCHEAERKSGLTDLGPCRVQVDLMYEFDPVFPLGVDIGGVRLGLPETVVLTRSSTFAISDFAVDPT